MVQVTQEPGSVAAGTEGFVVIRHLADTDVTSLLSASGNGVDWFDAESAPTDVRHVAPSGSDWVAIGPGSFEDRTEDSTTTSWFSANGLDWVGVGELDLDAVDIGGGDACKEYVTHLISAGGVLVASTVLSYPCSEGGVVRYGRSSLSMDRGSSWDELAFLRSGQDPDSRGRGATVNAATPVQDGILLVGERDYQAAFWKLPAAQ